MPSSLTAVQNGIGSSVSAGSGAQASHPLGQLRQQGIGAGLGSGKPGRGTSSPPRAGPWVEAEASKGNHGGSTLQQGQTS